MTNVKTYPSINQSILLLILIFKYCTNQSKIIILQLQHRSSSLTTLLHHSFSIIIAIAGQAMQMKGRNYLFTRL